MYFHGSKYGGEVYRNIPTKNSRLIPYQCLDDIASCLIGFTELCSGLFSRVDMDVLIIPYIIKDKKQIYKNVFKG